MPSVKRSLIAVIVLSGLALGGCGGSSSPSIPIAGQHLAVRGSSVGKIVLSQIGAERIGVRMAKARGVPPPQPSPPVVKATVVNGVKHTTTTPSAPPTLPAGSPKVIVPYSAIVYDPSGKTYTFTRTGRLTFVEVPVSVDHIAGNSAYLVKGPRAGAKVVSVGAEELYGVQSGVLAQT